jgi:molybdenum cofactor cytidylyltransferase
MISAILLAAGSSLRMGSVNKLLLPWQGSTIVATTTARLLAAAPEEVIVVTGHQATRIEAALDSLPVRFIHNPSFATGITSSIQKGAGIAKGEGYMICLADMVLVTPEEYTLLSTSFQQRRLLDDRCIILPEFNGVTGNPVIFSSAYRSDILGHREMEGCKTLVRSNPHHQVRVSMPFDHVLRDIDYPDDYKSLTATGP